MTQPGESHSPEVWVTDEGGVASTRAWRDRLAAGDPAAHRELAALCDAPPGVDRLYSTAELRTAVFMAAGLGAACVMKEAPKVVFPTEEIERGCEAILDDAATGVLG